MQQKIILGLVWDLSYGIDAIDNVLTKPIVGCLGDAAYMLLFTLKGRVAVLYSKK